MTVELPVIESAGATGQYAVTGRIQLACEVLEPLDAFWTRVRLLQSGAGMAEGEEIDVPTAKLSEEWDGSI